MVVDLERECLNAFKCEVLAQYNLKTMYPERNLLYFVKSNGCIKSFNIVSENKSSNHGYGHCSHEFNYSAIITLNDVDYEVTIRYDYEGGSCSYCDPIEAIIDDNLYMQREVNELKFTTFDKVNL